MNNKILSNPTDAYKVALSGGNVKSYADLEDKARQAQDKAAKALKKKKKAERQNKKKNRRRR